MFCRREVFLKKYISPLCTILMFTHVPSKKKSFKINFTLFRWVYKTLVSNFLPFFELRKSELANLKAFFSCLTQISKSFFLIREDFQKLWVKSLKRIINRSISIAIILCLINFILFETQKLIS